MSKRFMLSAAGVSAAAIGGAASAAIVQFHYDAFPGEASWQIADSDGNIVAQNSAVTSSSFFNSATGSAFVSSGIIGLYDPTNVTSYGYLNLVNLDLAAGDYTITMFDVYSDGWVDTGYGGFQDGSDAFTYGSYVLAFTSGASVSGTFTVVPAPGALALLGLAGLAGTRRRRA